jgi:undecaprenol kinase
MKGQGFFRRLGFALQGLRWALRHERSIRTHALATVVVACYLAIQRPPAVWWALAALSIALVVVAELINSALETLIDHLHPDIHPTIGAAKDIAAGAVLVASVMALVVAVACLVGNG